MQYRRLLTTSLALFLITGTVIAEPIDDNNYTEAHIEKLNQISFLPGLLPVIIENSDMIELNDEQLEKLVAWHKANSGKLNKTRNRIVQKRIEIQEAALSPTISSARLIQMQNDVFRLQREMLEHKLACRELVINTFTRKNWEGFLLVLAEHEIGVILPETYITSR